MTGARFDLAALFRDVDAERIARGLSWAGLARDLGVSASTVRRFADADDAEADGVLTVVAWLGTAPEHYVTGATIVAERLSLGESCFVRVDMDLVNRLLSHGRPRNRTTIQRLVVVAKDAGLTITSLTRHTDS